MEIRPPERTGSEPLEHQGGPERTCIGCGSKKAKSELIRWVLAPDGRPEIDRTGHAPGRGGYLCGPGCLKSALKRRSFSRAFRGRATPDSSVMTALVALAQEKS